MRKKLLWDLCLVALFASAAACTPHPARDDRAAPYRSSWRILGTWAGRGSTQTPSFDVATGALRLRWQTRNESEQGAGTFRVSLHSAISGRWLQTLADVRGTGGDAVHFADEPRLSYLVIESENVDWTATLEEAVPATSD